MGNEDEGRKVGVPQRADFYILPWLSIWNDSTECKLRFIIPRWSVEFVIGEIYVCSSCNLFVGVFVLSPKQRYELKNIMQLLI